MRKPIALACALLAAAASALALTPSTDLFLPSVGRGQGSCPGGVCSEWRTDVWVLNSGSATAMVEVSFLVRGADNTSPASETLTLAAGETRELADVMLTLFGVETGFGALRFAADREVAVCSRIYDAHVQKPGTGTAGQFFAARRRQPSGAGDATDLVGLARMRGTWRTNFGPGDDRRAKVLVELLDGNGARWPRPPRSRRLRGGPALPGRLDGPQENQRLRAASGGSGRVLTRLTLDTAPRPSRWRW
jgi:hypothetical protein